MKILFLPVKSEFVNYADQYYHDIDDVIYKAGYDAYIGPFVCLLAFNVVDIIIMSSGTFFGIRIPPICQ